MAALLLAACGSRSTPLGQLPPEQLWQRAQAELAAEDWDAAIRYLEAFVVMGGAGPRVDQARYDIGRAHFEREEYVTSAAEFSRLAGDLGRAELADDARFMACRSYEELAPDPQLDQEYTRAAIEHCSALAEYFADSEFAPRAAAIVERMRGRLAEKVFEAGEWYFRRRALDSAIIYFEDVFQQFPDTRWAPRALGKLVEIYETLEYEEELEAMRQRLLRDYPESPEARRLAG